MTATQFVDRMRDGVADRLAATLLEYDVPIQCVASLLLRVSYLAFAPGSVIKRPVEFLRNFAVPARAGTIEADSRIQSAIEYVNEIMTVATGEEFDCMLLLQEPLPDLVEMLV
jgi:hypothetical protein